MWDASGKLGFSKEAKLPEVQDWSEACGLGKGRGRGEGGGGLKQVRSSGQVSSPFRGHSVIRQCHCAASSHERGEAKLDSPLCGVGMLVFI